MSLREVGLQAAQTKTEEARAAAVAAREANITRLVEMLTKEFDAPARYVGEVDVAHAKKHYPQFSPTYETLESVRLPMFMLDDLEVVRWSDLWRLLAKDEHGHYIGGQLNVTYVREDSPLRAERIAANVGDALRKTPPHHPVVALREVSAACKECGRGW